VNETSQWAIVFSQLAWSWVLLAWCIVFFERSQKLFKGLSIFSIPRTSLAIVIFTLIIANIPYGPTHYLRGLMFTPSLGLLFLSFYPIQTLWQQDKRSTELSRQSSLMPIIALLAVFLYPMALGLGLWDPYRLGYSPVAHWSFALICFCINIQAIRLGGAWREHALWLTLTLLAFSLALYEGQNLWDALIDPFASIWAIYILFKKKDRLSISSLITPHAQ